MSRLSLAFSSFFRLLFGRSLDPRAADYLPASASKEHLGLPEPQDGTKVPVAEPSSAAKPATKKKPAAHEESLRHRRDGALLTLGLLQREGRLVDFLRESLDDHDDATIGAAVRDIHRGCRSVVAEHFEIEPVMPGEEDSDVQIPEGFDPTEIRLIGNVSGSPPFHGTLRHHGWRATSVHLPSLTGDIDRQVLAPAEVEVEG